MIQYWTYVYGETLLTHVYTYSYSYICIHTGVVTDDNDGNQDDVKADSSKEDTKEAKELEKSAEYQKFEEFLEESQFRTGAIIGGDVPLTHIFANQLGSGQGSLSILTYDNPD